MAKADPGKRIRALLMLHNRGHLEGSRARVVRDLQDAARTSQNEVEAALEERALTSGDVTVVNRFWITNMLLVEFTADNQRLQTMAAIPGVRRVIPNFRLTAPKPIAGAGATIVDGEITWGMDKIQADQVWDELGVNGAGVRVATLDTGVDISHPDLAGKMVTDDPSDPLYPGGWMEFDSAGNLVRSQPHDSAYHGTHVSGTIHGGDDSGVAIGGAYGAGMMHGLVIPGGGGSFAQVAAGMQWTVAPVDADGNPAGEPADVVNMSLGGNGFHDEMIAPTRAMRAAGTFPAFAIGNNCGSLGTASPGNVYEAVGVGATDDTDNVAGFSCGGVVEKSRFDNPPADWPDSYVKPNISAPGVDVWSASPGGGYRYLSGTSMATPHTAATAALMRSAAPELTVDQMLDTLGDTAFWEDRYADQPPDTRYGMGRINAYEAVRTVAIDSGISGTVTDASTGDAVSDAAVTVTPGDIEVTTGEDGGFTARVEPGSYTVKTSAFGYRTSTVDGVAVTADTFTTVDTTLRRGPRGSISGTVAFSESGEGIPGVAVNVEDTPVDFSAVTNADGDYTISDVPVGDYQVAADHPTFVAPAAVDVTVTEGGTAAADYVFDAPPRTVALVGRYVDQYRDEVFAPRGIETVVYSWDELLDAAQHTTVVLGYGLSSDYDPDTFQAFLDATDANGAGVIFTHHAYGTASGIIQLSDHTGQPESADGSSGGSGSAESYYEITADHPILAGYQPGDHLVIDNSAQAKWVGWFDGYAGDGRQTIANLGRTADGVLGGGIGVDERANNRHVLLSTHGVSVTRGPQDWTPEATQLFLNAINWASPPPVENQPYFALHQLRVGPKLVKANQSVSVEASVKNVGGSAGDYDAALVINGQVAETTTVHLASGESATVDWAVSRDQLGVYDVRVGYLTDSFRVRAPVVDLTAHTVQAPDGVAEPGPLAGATVELIDDGAVVPAGVTDADGKLSFETPDAVGEYTLVVRRARADKDSEAYLLHRTVTVIDDKAVAFSPRVLSNGDGGDGADGVGDDLSARADLHLDRVNQDHTGLVYLRPASTAPYGYRFTPGAVIASLGTYEAVTLHQVDLAEQEWWLPSRVTGGLDWTDPVDVTLSFGGAPKAKISDVSVSESGEVSVDWQVADGHGRPFATVLAGDLRPFVDLPELVELEHIEGLLRGALPNEKKPILRLFDPTGEQVRAGGIDWQAQPYTFTLDEGAMGGRHKLALEAGVGGYGDTATDKASMQVGDIELSTSRPDAVALKSTAHYEVRAVNSGDTAGPLTWTVRVENSQGALDAGDVELRLDTGTRSVRVDLAPGSDGALVGTVSENITLAAGEQTWQLSVKIRGDSGDYAFIDTFAGEGVKVAVMDRISAASRVTGRGEAGDNRLAGLGG